MSSKAISFLGKNHPKPFLNFLSAGKLGRKQYLAPHKQYKQHTRINVNSEVRDHGLRYECITNFIFDKHFHHLTRGINLRPTLLHQNHNGTNQIKRLFHETGKSQIHGTPEQSKDGLSGRSAHELYEKLAGNVARLEKATTIYGYSSLKMAGALFLIAGAGMFLFREVIRDNVAGEVSTVATKTLSDENLQQKTQEITIDLLHTIFKSPQIQREAVTFLEKVFAYPETQAALTSLLLNVIRRPDTKTQLARMLKDIINQSLRDDEFRTQLAQHLKLLLSDDNTKQAVLDILFFVLNDDDILEATKGFVQQILASNRVQYEAAQLGKRALNDIVDDQDTQKHTGDALWNAFQYSITPAPSRWFHKKDGSKDQSKDQRKDQNNKNDTDVLIVHQDKKEQSETQHKEETDKDGLHVDKDTVIVHRDKKDEGVPQKSKGPIIVEMEHNDDHNIVDESQGNESNTEETVVLVQENSVTELESDKS